MLHIPSAAGPVSSRIAESSATTQTEMHTNKAPKHVPRENVKNSQYINNKERSTHLSHLWLEGILFMNVFTAVEELWEGFETAKGLPW